MSELKQNLEVLFISHQRYFLVVAHRYLYNIQDCEDAVQEAFCQGG